jgi:DNA-binding MarR family transcriptional regulator
MTNGPNVNEVAAAIQKSIGIFVRQLRLIAVEGELTPPEYSALSRLDRNGPTTTTAMARAEQITTQSMGATLSSLESRGYLVRRLDPSDGRKSILLLTSAGRRALRSKRDARTLQLAKALSAGFTDAELRQLMTAVPLIERLVYLI